jgi:hypothetical protein
MHMSNGHHKLSEEDFVYVRLDMHHSETKDQAKDGGKKSFEVPSAREKVKEAVEPNVRGEEEDLLRQG